MWKKLIVLFYILFVVVNCVALNVACLIVLFYVLLACKCVLCYWHRVATKLQLTIISNIVKAGRQHVAI